MFNKRIVALFALLVCALFMAGCWDEEKCKIEFELHKSPVECVTKYGTDTLLEVALSDEGGAGGGTPIIILEPTTTTGPISWREQDEAFFAEGPSMFLTDGSCQLREDFIGRKTLIFEYLKDGDTNWQTQANALTDKDIVHAKKGGTILELRMNGRLGLHWKVNNCTPVALKTYTPSEVPKEIYELLNNVGGEPPEINFYIQAGTDPAIPAEKVKFKVIIGP